MRRTELSTRNALRSRIRNIVIGTSSFAIAIASMIYAGVELTAIGEMTTERKQQVFLQPQETKWSSEPADSEFRAKRQIWETRLLQLRREKQSAHPDMVKAEQLVPLYLKAEDASRRLSMIQTEDASMMESLRQDLASIEQQLTFIETRTD